MIKTDWILRATLLAIALFLGIIAVRPLVEPSVRAQAQAARFDHVSIISPVFMYKGRQGLLVMDKRNANVWFIPRVDDEFKDAVFVLRLPFEKLDQAPQ
ncbi:MAG TPA: hypothetical protein VMH28_31255 [Candidatus Acidoferrales bacterium]|nr:hypothetical protein [Candidatus Acidoferrales bacterium]